MKLSQKLVSVIASVGLIVLVTISAVAFQDPPKSLEANVNGTGTLSVGKEEFKLYAVSVKLKEGGAAEVTLVSDISIYTSGEWTAAADNSKGIDLKITGGSSSGSAQGSGKLFLTPDGKSIARLTISGIGKNSGVKYTASFVAQ